MLRISSTLYAMFERTENPQYLKFFSFSSLHAINAPRAYAVSWARPH